MPVPHHLTFHGGGGAILSVGLLRQLDWEGWQECVKSMRWRQGGFVKQAHAKERPEAASHDMCQRTAAAVTARSSAPAAGRGGTAGVHREHALAARRTPALFK